MTQLTERTLQAPDGRLALLEGGPAGAPVVVLVHGYPDTKEVWTGVARRLAERHRVVAYDVRGAGRSDRPATPAGYALSCLTQDVLAVLDDVAPDRPVHLVGHDWGSLQGWEFVTRAHAAPRFASFTSISGPSLDFLGAQAWEGPTRPDRWPALVEQFRRSWYVGALLVPGAVEAAWPLIGEAARPWLLADAAEGPDAPPRSPVALARAVAEGAWLYRQNVPWRMLAPRRDAVARLPVQLVVPDGDPFLAPATYDGLEAFAPDLRRVPIAGGHWVVTTDAEAVAGLIAGFVADVEARRPVHV